MEFQQADVNQTITDRFRSIVLAYPERTALADESKTWTYRELDRVTDALAARVVRQTGGTSERVVILLPSGASCIVALLAIGKAGAVYVPLDPEWPVERLSDIIREVEPVVIVADGHVIDTLSKALPYGGPWLNVDDASGEPGDLPAVQPASATTAAIYYTSGSTGAPRGVMLSHRCLLNSTRNYIIHMQVTPVDRVAWISPFSFGASTGPIFGALLSGAGVWRFDVKRNGLSLLAGWMEQWRITVLMTVPSLFRDFAATLSAGRHLPELRLIKLGGEPVYASDAKIFEAVLHRGCVLLNGLGISEAGGNVCFYRHSADRLISGEKNLPLGKAAGGMELFILDETGQPVASGQMGEIAVRSPFLADGYWRNAGLSVQKFRPFDGDDIPVYRTGDLGLINENGDLVHHGRRDAMVKMSGYRIELTEVEAAIIALDAVGQAAVVLRDNLDASHLVAFVVWRDGRSMTLQELRQALGGKLPAYMIPAHFSVVVSLPMLTNGKVDRWAIKQMSYVPMRDAPATRPRNEQEFQLLRIMEKVLGISGAGIHDDFFEIGGDSLSAARMFAMMHHRLGINIPISVMGKSPTVAKLAELIDQRQHHQHSSSTILLEAGEDNAAPFFCAPGAGSDAFALIPLARYIGRRHPFYALQYRGLDGRDEFQDDLEKIAEYFLEDIRRIQPKGPYFLGGSSFGGWVAFAIAQQLVRDGEKVAVLALLDTYGPGYPCARSGRSLSRSMRLAMRWILPMGKKESISRANILHGVREKWNALRVRLGLIARRPGQPLPLLLRYASLQQHCFRARRNYDASPYPGVIDLFRAKIQPSSLIYETSEDLGWRELAGGGLVIHDTPGYHTAHIREPHVNVLAARLLKCMEAAGQHQQYGESMLISAQSKDAWSRVADWWDQATGDDGHADTRGKVVPVMDRMLGAEIHGHVLDVGCGNGWYARRLARKGAIMTAFDFSDKMIERAMKHDRNGTHPIAYHVLDAASPDDWLRLSAGRFQKAYAYMVLMDVSDLSVLMRGVYQVLEPGGCFVAAMVHPESRGLDSLVSGHILKNINTPAQPESTYYFHRTINDIHRIAAESGFVPAEAEHVLIETAAALPNKILVVKWVKPAS